MFGIGSLAGLAWPASSVFAEISVSRKIIVGAGSSICRVDLNNGQVEQIPLGLTPHGFAVHPQNPDRVWAAEKWGPSAAEVDFGDRKILRSITCPDGKIFFGHGAFGPDGKTYFAVRGDMITGKGHLVGFGDHGDKPVVDYQLTPGAMHDCHTLPNGHMLVTSSGILNTHGKKGGPRVAPASLYRFNPQTGKVLSIGTIDDPDVTIGHLAVANDGTILVGSAAYLHAKIDLSRIYVSHDGGKILQEIPQPHSIAPRMRNEILSMAIDADSRTAAVTDPAGMITLIIDLKQSAVVDMIDVKCSGVAFDQISGKFYFNSDGIQHLDLQSKHMEMLQKTAPDGNAFESSHMLFV